jgi:hypothetical protein
VTGFEDQLEILPVPVQDETGPGASMNTTGSRSAVQRDFYPAGPTHLKFQRSRLRYHGSELFASSADNVTAA